jgi:hypothetical protein
MSLPNLSSVAQPIVNNLLHNNLPQVAETAGSIAGGLFPYMTLSLTAGQAAADRLIGPKGNPEEWKAICTLATGAAWMGLMCFAPSFLGQGIIYGIIGSIFGGMQGLRAVGASIPEGYAREQVTGYAQSFLTILRLIQSQLSSKEPQ